MIATDRMVFLHLHKSGGTFVNVLLMRCMRSAKKLGYHLPYRQIPPSYRNLPVVGTVRSPWAYYVSWYHFQLTRPQRNILFQVCSNEGQLDLKSTVTNLVELAGDDARLSLLEHGLPEDFPNRGVNLTKSCIRELREKRVGFYSFLYERLYAEAHAPRIVRMESLREELRATLSSLGHLPNPCADQFLNHAPPLNVSPHGPPASYYDDALAALIAERDRTVIDRYGYSL